MANDVALGMQAWSWQDVEVLLPFTELLSSLLQAGMGIQIRAEVPASSLEADALNNDMSSGWTLESLPVVGA